MTNKNKLPKIGKRYKDKNHSAGITTFIGEYEGKLVHAMHYVSRNGTRIITPTHASICEIDDFWEWFEELPDQEPTKEVERDCPNEEAIEFLKGVL